MKNIMVINTQVDILICFTYIFVKLKKKIKPETTKPESVSQAEWENTKWFRSSELHSDPSDLPQGSQVIGLYGLN